MITAQAWMSDGKGGTMQAPTVLDEEEAIRFLRLDKSGAKDPADTLAYYRKLGKLKGKLIGRRMVYLLADLIAFVNDIEPGK